MHFYRHLDWLSFTVTGHGDWRQIIRQASWKYTGKGRHGYSERYEDAQTGTVVEMGSNRDDMGVHFTMTGAPLAEYRAATGVTDDELTTLIAQVGGKVSRIDLALDCYGVRFKPRELLTAIKERTARIPARVYRLHEGHRGQIVGETFETGSPVSDRRFRLYDKRAEQRIKDGEAWMRLELQLRRLYAKAASGSCAENGTEATVTGMIGAYLSWENEEYTQALISEQSVPDKTARKPSKRRMWLNGQVARALAHEIALSPEYEAQFYALVRYWLEQERQSSPDDL